MLSGSRLSTDYLLLESKLKADSVENLLVFDEMQCLDCFGTLKYGKKRN